MKLTFCFINSSYMLIFFFFLPFLHCSEYDDVSEDTKVNAQVLGRELIAFAKKNNQRAKFT